MNTKYWDNLSHSLQMEIMVQLEHIVNYSGNVFCKNLLSQLNTGAGKLSDLQIKKVFDNKLFKSTKSFPSLG